MSATTTSIDAVENRLLPVQLLRDGRGIYGIGVSDLYDFEAVARSCGVKQPLHRPPPLILRPDWFIDTEPSGAVLQKIVGGFRVGPFMHSCEEQLRRFIHHEALNRARLPWPPSRLPNGGRQTKSGRRTIGASITVYASSRFTSSTI